MNIKLKKTICVPTIFADFMVVCRLYPSQHRHTYNFPRFPASLHLFSRYVLGIDYICLDTSHGKIENFSKIVRGGQPPIFFYESKHNHKWGLHAKFQTSSSKTVDLHPHPNFLLFWPVNSVCGQTKGQIRFSIAEMDSLGSITYV